MYRLELIIFDMDGLLVDTEIHYRTGWLVASKKLGIPLEKDVVDTWVGKGVHETSQYLFKLTGQRELVQQLREEREKYFYRQLNTGKVELKQGAFELIRFLRENGIALALVSSSARKRAEAILEYFGVLSAFQYTVFGDEVRHVKPDPEPYLRVLSASKKKRNSVLVLEDSLTGVEAAMNAKLSAIMVPDDSFYSSPFKDVPNNVQAQFHNLFEVKSYLSEVYIK